jgi:hypothetical protein
MFPFVNQLSIFRISPFLIFYPIWQKYRTRPPELIWDIGYERVLRRGSRRGGMEAVGGRMKGGWREDGRRMEGGMREDEGRMEGG